RSVKRKYSEDYIKFGFSCQEKEGVDLPQCVICFKAFRNDSMKLAKLKLHLEKRHSNLLQKDEDYFERWLSGLKWQRLDSTSAFYNKTSNAVRTSYIVAYKVVQAKEPHTIVEQLVFPCTKEMVWLVLGKEAARKLNDISVFNNTISRWINEISQNISEQFAIQLDESTDVASCSQLLVFAQFMVEGDFKDEFLFCKILDITTKAQDVMEIVNNFFEVHGLDWVNLVGVTTDGAPAMLGSRSGFQTLVKQHAPMVTLGSFGIKNAIFKGLVKVVNHIKSSVLNTRLFKRFCLDMGSTDVLLFYTFVRWLSAGNVLNSVFQLKEELDLFLQAQGKEEFRNVLTQSNLELAYLDDIFGILNKLNLQLQGKGANLLSRQSTIKKLELWIVRVEGNNLVQFPYVDAMLGEKEAIRMQILDHLQKRYFPEVDRTRDGLSFIRNPFTTDVSSVPEDLQEEFLDLKNDFTAQDLYQQSTIEKFWASVTGSYPNLSAHAVRFLLPFASTYV
uniref:DUF4371 domain-containing protein n=1 Tax=Pelodiscus sinensis TaxID=13735 RepID=K7G8N1_PELSI